MPLKSLAEKLVQQLSNLQKEKGSVSADDFRKIIQELSQATNEELFRELQSIASRIGDIRSSGVKAPQGKKISKEFLPSANLELEAIVKTTEQATNTILDAAENIQKAAAGTPAAEQISQQVSKIFEACNFQDITGQRVSSIVKTLVEIEKELQSFLSGGTGSSESAKPKGPQPLKKPEGKIDESSLMNGPQLEQPSQGDVDKLFDSL